MKRTALVRYVPLIGSPSTMPEADAERYLKRDDDLYLRLVAAGVRPAHAPRIERPSATAKRGPR